MGRKVMRLSTEGLNKGAWTKEEDRILKAYMEAHGEGKWSTVPKNAGLKRCGRSCRLRWLNYLKPGIKRGNITLQEEDLIIRLHNLLGNRWSLIAGRLPGRTDNEIKNYWNTVLHKKVQQARNDSSEQRAASTSTEVPELIRTIPIRLTKIPNASCNITESNITDLTGRNSSLSGEFSPEVESSNRVISGSTDTQTESLWQFMLSLDFNELTAIGESHLQSDCTNVVHQLQYASDFTVPSYAGLEA